MEKDKVLSIVVDGKEKETIKVPLYGKIEIEILNNKVVFIAETTRKKVE